MWLFVVGTRRAGTGLWSTEFTQHVLSTGLQAPSLAMSSVLITAQHLEQTEFWANVCLRAVWTMLWLFFVTEYYLSLSCLYRFTLPNNSRLNSNVQDRSKILPAIRLDVRTFGQPECADSSDEPGIIKRITIYNPCLI